ncbi:BTB/POZ domain-containing protein 9 [Apodemus speciosus]|uniref:BTB/POZ domain-containing protein 9 n=1 Tax=Apodemus speciosus TaxID=105296 RepID=A0ABQ0FNJ7_APOSI
MKDGYGHSVVKNSCGQCAVKDGYGQDSCGQLLLWDCDDRSYSYYVEVSTNQQQWTMVADRTKVSCKSWQSVTFERQPASFIRIVGTHNTANEVFHCVHFECPEQQSNQKEDSSEEPGTGDLSTPSQQLDPHAPRAPSASSLPPSPGSNSRSPNQQNQ